MEKQKVDFSSVKKLIVKVVSSNVTIMGSDPLETYISYTGRQPDLELKDDVLTITLKENNLFNVFDFGFKSSNGEIIIAAPYELMELSLNGVSSDVEVKTIKVNNLSLRTVSGDLSIDDVYSKQCQIKTVSGDVTISSSRLEKAVFTSVSGDLLVKGLNCDNYEWILSTASGDLTVETAGIPDLRLSMRTASGDLTTNIGYTREGRDYIFGDGKMKITVSSASGDVCIKSTNRAERTENIEKKILKLVASGKLSYEQAKQILDELIQPVILLEHPGGVLQ